MSYIELKELSYWYAGEDKKSLNCINLKIESGEILFVVGKSGSGKSTFGKALTGAVPQFYGGRVQGEITVQGKPLTKIAQEDRAKEITMVFQDPERQLMMNRVHSEIAFGLENIAVEESTIQRRVWEAMQFSNITELAYRDISTLSGGEKQRVAITSAIAYLPKCIILDEPTSQLDPSAAEEVITLVKKINEELGVTIIIIEQRIDKWFDIADRILVMEEGAVRFIGSKRELYKEGIEEFFPEYLKLARRIGLEEPPKGFRAARNYISDKDFIIKTLTCKDTESKEQCISIKKMSCSYGSIKALKNISLEVKNGDFIGIIGSNGAGKSTLLRCLMGLNRYEGTLQLFGKEIKKLKLKEISKNIGYVSQNPNDYISKDTVYEEVKFTLDNYGDGNYSFIEEILTKLDLFHLKDRNPRDLSGGEKQRVAIASILAAKPKILMLDEPTRGLDYNTKFKLGELLRELNSEGTTIILITHDMDFAANFCRRFLLLFNGSVAAFGNHSKVMSEGIYFTTSLNKLFRHKDSDMFSISQFVEMKKL